MSQRQVHELSLDEKAELYLLLETKRLLMRDRKMDTMFPTDGPLRRELYKKQIDFFKATKKSNEVMLLGGNRTGKTCVGAYAIAVWTTGEYPDWWAGRVFDGPVDVWIAGDTSKTVRDIVQTELLGPADQYGTGMLPKKSIGTMWKASGTAAYMDTVEVMHTSGTPSRIQFKSYDQGRKAFQGTKKDIIWLDEESDDSIYQECLMRTMTTGGLVIQTMTPLMGLTPLINSFKTADPKSGRIVITVTWDDVPHLTQQDKDRLYAGLPPHQRDARSRGVPQLGAGAIYPVPESGFSVPPFEIPKHWRRVYALDVGWNFTAVVWYAIDPDTGVRYIYSTHKQGEERPLFHADAIKARGAWIPGVIDPASRGRSQDDGAKLVDQYKGHGLALDFANNAVEAGIYAVWEALSTGKLKVFSTVADWFAEFRTYHRDEKGRIVKKDDHLMDATRYGWMAGDKAIVEPVSTQPYQQYQVPNQFRPQPIIRR
jgi:phage terminase large subunit-like protein